MKNTKKWPTDNEEHRRYCEDCEAKYKGLRQCPDCDSRNTFIDEVVLRPLRQTHSKEQTVVDLGEDTTCVVCEKRECTCPERQKDGSWKSKEQTFEEKWLAIDEKTWLERSQHPDPQTVLTFFKTEVSELLAEIRLVIGAMEEWDRNATPDEKRDYAQIYKDLESHLDNIAGRYVPK